ncbi:hypothetical protein ACSQ67_001204 [Phaseolus vulgaris]
MNPIRWHARPGPRATRMEEVGMLGLDLELPEGRRSTCLVLSLFRPIWNTSDLDFDRVWVRSGGLVRADSELLRSYNRSRTLESDRQLNFIPACLSIADSGSDVEATSFCSELLVDRGFPVRCRGNWFFSELLVNHGLRVR